VAAARARLADTGGWLRDAVARYPSLPHRLREAGGLCFPVSVHVAFHNRALPECGESALALVIARDGCQLVYDPEVVSEETATAILRELEDLLMQIAAGEADVNPTGGIGADEREQVLFAWNDTQRESEPATRIHRRFEEQVDAEPSTRATIFRGDADSYGELETRANHIAQTLFDRGARPGHRIGVALPRDLDLAPSVLAVLKLGAAWAPLEARPTAASLNASIETLGLDQIVACGGEAQAGVEAAVLDLDADSDEIHSHTDERPQLDVAAEPLAAILPANDGRFVELSGANLEHLFDALDECIGTTHGTWLSLPQTSPATSALEQLWALTRGFEVIIADEPALPGSAAPAGQSLMLPGAGYAADDHSLAALLDRHRVSHFLCSEESLSDLVSDGGALRGLKEVRRILLLADTPAVSAEVRGAIASAEISVICGRRETSGVALHQPLPATSSFVPGGWPLPNTRAYVLGDDMGPQPVGIAGRLWIGGAGVALGYLNDPAAEAEAFADDPFRADGSRMFDTGLCARWLPEERIELLRDDAAPTPAQPRREPARERPRRLADL
jgi:non-ribosomal peptide synthetase component F